MLGILANAGKSATAVMIMVLGVTLIQTVWPISITDFRAVWEEAGNQRAYACLNAAVIFCGLFCIFGGPAVAKPKWYEIHSPGFAVLLIISTLMLASGCGFISNFHIIRYYDSCPGPGPC